MAPKPHYVPKSPCEPPKSAFPDQPRRLSAERPKTPSYLSTALVPIGDDGGIRDPGRIGSDQLELKLLRELIYSFQGIEGS